MKYKIYWYTLIPISGIVTKPDAKKIGDRSFNKKECSRVNATKEKAEQRLQALKGKLSKKYIAVLYTDAQFGLRKPGSDLTTILTQKQLKEAILIQ